MNAQILKDKYQEASEAAWRAILNKHRNSEPPDQARFESLHSAHLAALSFAEALAFEPDADNVLEQIEKEARAAWDAFRNGGEDAALFSLAAVVASMDKVKNNAARLMAEEEIRKERDSADWERAYYRALHNQEAA